MRAFLASTKLPIFASRPQNRPRPQARERPDDAARADDGGGQMRKRFDARAGADRGILDDAMRRDDRARAQKNGAAQNGVAFDDRARARADLPAQPFDGEPVRRAQNDALADKIGGGGLQEKILGGGEIGGGVDSRGFAKRRGANGDRDFGADGAGDDSGEIFFAADFIDFDFRQFAAQQRGRRGERAGENLADFFLRGGRVFFFDDGARRAARRSALDSAVADGVWGDGRQQRDSAARARGESAQSRRAQKRRIRAQRDDERIAPAKRQGAGDGVGGAARRDLRDALRGGIRARDRFAQRLGIRPDDDDDSARRKPGGGGQAMLDESDPGERQKRLGDGAPADPPPAPGGHHNHIDFASAHKGRTILDSRETGGLL